MSDASYAQTSFLGGEISLWAQGQFDRPLYPMSLAKAYNVLIVDEGAAPRRPGTKFSGFTRNGAAGRVIPFDFASDTPNDLEFTDGYLRFWDANFLGTSNDSQYVISVSNANPAVFTLAKAVNWKTGDQVYFTFSSAGNAVAGSELLNRQYVLTMLTSTTFTVADSITGAVVTGTTLGLATVGAFSFDGPLSSGAMSDSAISSSPVQRTVTTTLSPLVNHIAEIVTPYKVSGADWHSIRLVQGLNLAMLLHGQVAPQALQVVTPPNPTLSDPSQNQFAVFSYSTASFQDGPYLDSPASAIATPSGTSGAIQVTLGYATWDHTTVYGFGVPVTYNNQDYVSLANNNTGNTPSTSPSQWQALSAGAMINNGQGFLSTDVGRMIRLYSAPQNWDSAHTYGAGDTVTYNGAQFTSLQNSNTDNEPDISTTYWVLNTSAAIWTWGVITSVLSANSVNLQVRGNNLLYTTPCPLFRLGAWSNTTGWPTCGCYKEGRFWFGGATPNRIDASQPNAPFSMSPTAADGTVLDSSGITYTFNSNSFDDILWMEPQLQGILIGTQRGEYLLSNGGGSGPITPSNIAETFETKYGSANMLPVKTGLSLCFVQRYARRLVEYLADVFSQRFYGPDLTTYARHLGVRQFQELAYQQEPVPVVWGRMGDGSLVGTTYRRVSLFSSQPPEFNAWHQHALGSERLVESICVGHSASGFLDTLTMITNEPETGIRFVERMTTLMDETEPVTSAWFLDAAVVPPAAALSMTAVTFYGLHHLDGEIATVFAAGLDCGDFLVEDGQIKVPLGTKDALSGYTFDIPQFDILQPLASTFTNTSVTVVGSGVQYQIPCVIGFNYMSQGQLCRPMKKEDTGARNGPGFAKKRRVARYGINLVNSLGVQVGMDFNKMQTVRCTTPGGKTLPYLSMYSGIQRDSLSDSDSFDGQLCWQSVRPFPATVTAIGGFITTEDV